jgi:predicted RecA/RadA family phage recombinase
MAEATFVKRGDLIDYTAGADIDAGDVIIQSLLVGVAVGDIANGDTGTLDITGVFDFAKATTSVSAISVGVLIYWDDSSKTMGTDSGDVLAGKCVKAAAAADATVRGKLCP